MLKLPVFWLGISGRMAHWRTMQAGENEADAIKRYKLLYEKDGMNVDDYLFVSVSLANEKDTDGYYKYGKANLLPQEKATE